MKDRRYHMIREYLKVHKVAAEWLAHLLAVWEIMGSIPS